MYVTNKIWFDSREDSAKYLCSSPGLLELGRELPWWVYHALPETTDRHGRSVFSSALYWTETQCRCYHYMRFSFYIFILMWNLQSQRDCREQIRTINKKYDELRAISLVCLARPLELRRGCLTWWTALLRVPRGRQRCGLYRSSSSSSVPRSHTSSLERWWRRARPTRWDECAHTHTGIK